MRNRGAWLIAALVLPATVACVIEPGTINTPGEGPGADPAVTTVPSLKRYSIACETRNPGGYGSGFWDPREGGECWACPSTHQARTGAGVTEANACGHNVLGIGPVARAKYLGPHGKCPAGDMQIQGNCKYCPQGSSWSSEHGACVKA